MTVRVPEVSPIDKQLFPTIDDVEMALFSEGELVLLRGEKEHYTVDEVHRFEQGSPVYTRVASGIHYCKYESATVSINQDGDRWIASVARPTSASL